jgi:hypothetical protein
MRIPLVYFAAHGGLIKIGVSTDVPARLATIHTELRLSGEFELIGTMPGGYRLETKVHRCLRGHRETGEWFRDCGTTRRFISTLLKEGLPKGWDKQESQPPRKRGLNPDQLSRLTLILWPDDPVGGLATCGEVTDDVAREWINGTSKMPRLVRCAFACAALEYLGDDL